jgi:flagellin
MVISVNTNTSAMIALQNLEGTNRALEITQNRINTGLKVSGAKDNSAIFAIAQNARADVGALNAVQQSVSRAISIVDIAIAAGETVSNLLTEMKEKTVAAADPSLDTFSRQALNEDFKALLEQIQTVVSNAKFDGANILDGTLPNGLTVLADAEAVNTITVNAESLSAGGSILTLTIGSNLLTKADSSAALGLLNSSLQNVNSALARLGSAGKKLETHLVFLGKLEDSMRAGIGSMVDANLAEESAMLQALQVKQQLGVQALQIANSRPQLLLSLFGN